jgi:ribosomal small subunit protein bTHX
LRLAEIEKLVMGNAKQPVLRLTFLNTIFNFESSTNFTTMGKGDIKSKKGKLINGSYGRRRNRKILKLRKRKVAA